MAVTSFTNKLSCIKPLGRWLSKSNRIESLPELAAMNAGIGSLDKQIDPAHKEIILKIKANKYEAVCGRLMFLSKFPVFLNRIKYK